ncbi:hypothetical protein KEM54_001756 [Ascosphaera aggregata]|nr:hypothetical protein KEM54_001756 [Ascosphaera aggregata]
MMRYGPHKLLDTPTLQEIQPGEMKESRVEGYKGKKILVVNHGGKVYGLSTRCTHYGAPLAKGILSSDGKITCPWHGCDIEDAPALDDLKVYNVVEVAGELFMDIKDGDRQPFKERGVCRPPGRKVTKSDEHTIIIGA